MITNNLYSVRYSIGLLRNEKVAPTNLKQILSTDTVVVISARQISNNTIKKSFMVHFIFYIFHSSCCFVIE